MSRGRIVTVLVVTALFVACAPTIPPDAAPGTPRRATQSANGTDGVLTLRLPRPDERQHVILVHDVERAALWSEGRRTTTRLKYVFEVTRRVSADVTHGATYTIARLDGGGGVRPLQGTEVAVRNRAGSAEVTVNGAPATDEERAVLAALVAYEAAVRNAASLLPPAKRDSPNAAWQPSQDALAQFLRGVGAQVEPSAIQATGYVKERFACEQNTCAQLEIQLHASMNERIQVKGELHLWLFATRAEPPLKFLWELEMSEPGPGGRGPVEHRVVQRLEAVVVPEAE